MESKAQRKLSDAAIKEIAKFLNKTSITRIVDEKRGSENAASQHR